MQTNFVIQQLKIFLQLESWTNSFIKWLRRQPTPYWLSCTILGFVFIIADWVYLVVYSGYENVLLFRYGLYCFCFSYCLFISSYIDSTIKLTAQNSNIFSNIVYYKDPFKNSEKSLVIWPFMRILLILGVVILWAFYAFPQWKYSTNSSNGEFLLLTLLIFPIYFSIILAIQLAIQITRTAHAIYDLSSKSLLINIYDLSPLYQLSNLTQRISLLLLPISTALGFLSASLIDNDLSTFMEINNLPLLIAFISPGIISLLIAMLIFVLPVYWIRNKIIEAKNNHLTDTGTKLQLAIQRQDQYAKKGSYSKVAEINGYIESLTSRRETIKNISEWPWETRVFREFSVAIFIPLILWILQLSIARWLEK